MDWFALQDPHFGPEQLPGLSRDASLEFIIAHFWWEKNTKSPLAIIRGKTVSVLFISIFFCDSLFDHCTHFLKCSYPSFICFSQLIIICLIFLLGVTYKTILLSLSYLSGLPLSSPLIINQIRFAECFKTMHTFSL